MELAKWHDAPERVADALDSTPAQHMLALSGDTTDVESMLALNDLMNALGCSATECCMDGTRMEADLRSSYLLNASISGVEAADVCLVMIDAQIYGEIEIAISRETCEKCSYAYNTLFYAVRHSLTVRQNRIVTLNLYGDSDEHCDRRISNTGDSLLNY